MSSHPKGMPPRQDGLQLDISKTDTIVCENCGNASFIQAFFLKKQHKKSSFQSIRQLLADSKVTDFSDLYKLMFDTIDDWGQGHIAECILILSKYQQSDAVVVDKEINVMAMFVEIIGTIK